MKKIVLLASSMLLYIGVNAQTWSLDKSHAKLSFAVSHLMLSETEGNFKSFDAKITSVKEDFSDAVIEMTADVASVNTEDESRDKHLKTADFFDAEKFPTITFKSKSLKKIAGKTYKAVGDFTMHGVTKTVIFDVVFNGTGINSYTKKTIAGFKIKGMIKRSDFGVGNVPAAVVGEEINVLANVEFSKN